ncbi:hypothetical protein HDU96_004172 [Phlyctochytrium bullatum]|nr:hypothetical protein HDU96_004172 [Phlyctochytrium bullatum]
MPSTSTSSVYCVRGPSPRKTLKPVIPANVPIVDMDPRTDSIRAYDLRASTHITDLQKRRDSGAASIASSSNGKRMSVSSRGSSEVSFVDPMVGPRTFPW